MLSIVVSYQRFVWFDHVRNIYSEREKPVSHIRLCCDCRSTIFDHILDNFDCNFEVAMRRDKEFMV